MRIPHLLIASVLVSVLLTAGCKLRMDFTTNVLSADELQQEIAMVGEGPIAESMRSSENEPGGDEAEGWTVEKESGVNRDGDEFYAIRYSKVLSPADNFWPPSQSASNPPPKLDFNVIDTPAGREYQVRITLAPNAFGSNAPATETDNAEMAAEMAKLMASFIKMNWTITMPGEVVETNADQRTERGGVWNLPLDKMDQGRELVIVSRE